MVKYTCTVLCTLAKLRFGANDMFYAHAKA